MVFSCLTRDLGQNRMRDEKLYRVKLSIRARIRLGSIREQRGEVEREGEKERIYQRGGKVEPWRGEREERLGSLGESVRWSRSDPEPLR
jgi:hypothetical protein